ncbi:hypothetical protein FACS18949_03940 [Clostridia bacterium]|nr:hypothetical protein FACS18949_03940 [Clostridia bacterium]
MKKILAIAITLSMLVLCAVPALAAAPSGGTYFPLDDIGTLTTTGDRADKAGGNITFAEGKVGKAAVFDGYSGINLGNDLIKGKDYTVALWVKLDSKSSDWTPTFVGLPDADHFLSIIPSNGDGNFGAWQHNAGSDPEWSDSYVEPLKLGAWTHIAVTASGGTLTIYKNGKAAAIVTDTGINQGVAFDIFGNGGAFFLGTNYWDAPFKGAIDEVYVYNKALSAAQIGDIFNGESTDPNAPVNPKTGDGSIALIALLALVLASGGIIAVKRKA